MTRNVALARSPNSQTKDNPVNNIFMQRTDVSQTRDQVAKIISTPITAVSPSPSISASSTQYSIAAQRLSCATHIIFPAAPYDTLCLKLWVLCQNELYNLANNATSVHYLLEGLAFNRRFAKGVYHGIAPVIQKEKRTISCGPVIKYPELHQLDLNMPYALVMRRLPSKYRLDHWLYKLDAHKVYGTMGFLARSVADMHAQLQPLSEAEETLAYIPEKLALNTQLFGQALDRLAEKKYNMRSYRDIGAFMGRVQQKMASSFEQRVSEGFVKRCHGDLKMTNLWREPTNTPSSPKRPSQRLLALDCIDFNPKFCHIDILSDVAMLAVDLETRLSRFSGLSGSSCRGKVRDKGFLDIYLKCLDEKDMLKQDAEAIWPLLEYYMVEKAMICAYMNILYDGLPTLGRKYLDVALNHTRKLKVLLF